MKKSSMAFILIALFFVSSFLSAVPFGLAQSSQEPKVQWSMTYDALSGGSLIQTSDDGFALVGKTATPHDTALGNQYINYSSVLIKTDSAGNTVFRKDLPIDVFEGQDIHSVDVVFSFIVPADDGGYVLVGTTTLHRNSGTYRNFCMAKAGSQR
ncbi:MAG: hypothetical protein NWF00_07405 [Candidatus Bathyarchaeota archaeon]|nr:hypothetical protein [Candidatus Bathyarchaeota archaeon]